MLEVSFEKIPQSNFEDLTLKSYTKPVFIDRRMIRCKKVCPGGFDSRRTPFWLCKVPPHTHATRRIYLVNKKVATVVSDTEVLINLAKKFLSQTKYKQEPRIAIKRHVDALKLAITFLQRNVKVPGSIPGRRMFLKKKTDCFCFSLLKFLWMKNHK